MKPILSAIVLSALLAGCSGPVDPAASGSDPVVLPALATLDGTTWALRMEPLDAGGTAAKDYLRFADRVAGFMTWQDRGYVPGSFSTTPKDGAIGFEFQNKNDQGEILNVSGCANVDAVWGTLTWRRADWTVRTFRFRGTPKT